ncbi:MAG: hypothetical protein AAFZ15_31540, partial [Bacteroidota bacterium]
MHFSKKYLFLFIPLVFWAAANPSFFNPNIFQNKFNPDAGLIMPLNNKSTIKVSSNSSEAFKIQDGDLSTAWQSGAPLPTGFISNKNQNILLNIQPIKNENSSCLNGKNFTDGNINNAGTVNTIQGKSILKYTLKNSQLFSVSLKCQTNSPIVIKAEKESGELINIGTYYESNNF